VPRSQLRDLLRFLQLGERLFALLLGLLAVSVISRAETTIPSPIDAITVSSTREPNAVPAHVAGSCTSSVRHGSPVKATRR
jgi:hypothetical protein